MIVFNFDFISINWSMLKSIKHIGWWWKRNKCAINNNRYLYIIYCFLFFKQVLLNSYICYDTLKSSSNIGSYQFQGGQEDMSSFQKLSHLTKKKFFSPSRPLGRTLIKHWMMCVWHNEKKFLISDNSFLFIVVWNFSIYQNDWIHHLSCFNVYQFFFKKYLHIRQKKNGEHFFLRLHICVWVYFPSDLVDDPIE